MLHPTSCDPSGLGNRRNHAAHLVGQSPAVPLQYSSSRVSFHRQIAEAILLDSDASDEALERAKDLAEAVNERDEEAAGCEEEQGEGDERGSSARPAEPLRAMLPGWRRECRV